jgi:hypothetical protein
MYTAWNRLSMMEDDRLGVLRGSLSIVGILMAPFKNLCLRLTVLICVRKWCARKGNLRVICIQYCAHYIRTRAQYGVQRSRSSRSCEHPDYEFLASLFSLDREVIFLTQIPFLGRTADTK